MKRGATKNYGREKGRRDVSVRKRWEELRREEQVEKRKLLEGVEAKSFAFPAAIASSTAPSDDMQMFDSAHEDEDVTNATGPGTQADLENKEDDQNLEQP